MEIASNQLGILRSICVHYCETADSVLMILSKNPIKADDLGFNLGSFNDLFHKDGFQTRYETNTEITTYDVIAFENELRGNLFKMSESDRLVYKKIIDSEIGEYLLRVPVYYKWINNPPLFNVGPYINGIKINAWLGSSLIDFANNLKQIAGLLKKIDHALAKYYGLFGLDKLDTEKTQSVKTEQQEQAPEKGLSAPQKLLFVRLLQQKGLFPRKPANSDDAPELRAIALLTGLDFNNDIKGAKGANMKVNQMLYDRKSFTVLQIPYKIADLDAVEKVARLLNVEAVITEIQVIRSDIKKMRRT
ncbi:hypothetical protein ACFSUS_04920 [Spirosoma soli]|uniref:Uncharacterized protein n=1 Tax=Spirosoma soli TaxID=1770529 RepID=A0ABW5LZC5_9BACT